jgi:hypothetical protein
MARSCPALNPRRGGNQLLAEFVILTLEIADLLVQHDAPVVRFQILSIERLGQRAHGIRQRSIMDSKYVISPHHFLLSAGELFLFAAPHSAASRGTFNSLACIALVGCSDNLVILKANLSKSKKSHGPS